MNSENDIEHRLTLRAHPWVKRQIERMIKEATVHGFFVKELHTLKTHLTIFRRACYIGCMVLPFFRSSVLPFFRSSVRNGLILAAHSLRKSLNKPLRTLKRGLISFYKNSRKGSKGCFEGASGGLFSVGKIHLISSKPCLVSSGFCFDFSRSRLFFCRWACGFFASLFLFISFQNEMRATYTPPFKYEVKVPPYCGNRWSNYPIATGDSDGNLYFTWDVSNTDPEALGKYLGIDEKDDMFLYLDKAQIDYIKRIYGVNIYGLYYRLVKVTPNGDLLLKYFRILSYKPFRVWDVSWARGMEDKSNSYLNFNMLFVYLNESDNKYLRQCFIEETCVMNIAVQKSDLSILSQNGGKYSYHRLGSISPGTFKANIEGYLNRCYWIDYGNTSIGWNYFFGSADWNLQKTCYSKSETKFYYNYLNVGPIIKIGDKYWTHLIPANIASKKDNQWVQIDPNNEIKKQLKSSTISNPLVLCQDKTSEWEYYNSGRLDRENLYVIKRGDKFTVLQGFWSYKYKAYNNLWEDTNFYPWPHDNYYYFSIASWVADPEKGPTSYYVAPSTVLLTKEVKNFFDAANVCKYLQRFVVYEKDGQFYFIYLTTHHSSTKNRAKLGIARISIDDKGYAQLHTRREFTNKSGEATFPELESDEYYPEAFTLSGHYIWITFDRISHHILIDADELIQYAPQEGLDRP